MSLLTQPPVVPLATSAQRTDELRVGSEVVHRDGTTAFVSEVAEHGDGRRVVVVLTDGSTARSWRRGRRWRVTVPQSDLSTPS